MANRVKSLCSKIFNFACETAVIGTNPVEQIKTFKSSPSFHRALSIEEARRLYKHLDHEDIAQASALRIMLLTGQLPSKVLNMKWSDIQLDSWFIEGKKEYSVHLSPAAIEILKRLKSSNHIYIFEGKTGKPISHLRHLCKRINIDLTLDAIWRPIDLRKTVEVEMKALGIGIDVIAKVLNQKTLLKRLANNSENLEMKAQKALNKWAMHLLPKEPRKIKDNSKVIPLFPK